jgi:hypothetical protein
MSLGMKGVRLTSLAVVVSIVFMTGSARVWAVDEGFKQELAISQIENFKAAFMVWRELAASGCEDAATYRDLLAHEIQRLQISVYKKKPLIIIKPFP